MLNNCREQEAMIKGEYAEVCGKDPKDVKKRKLLKRIHEYEKFLANCNRMKETEKNNQEQLKKKRRHTMIEGMYTEPMFSVLIRSKSLSYLEVIQTSEDTRKTDRFSLPPLPDYDSSLNLQDKIILWQSCGGPYHGTGWVRVPPLTHLKDYQGNRNHMQKSQKRSKSVVHVYVYAYVCLFILKLLKRRKNSTTK